jgi:VWFA-related protein
MTSFSARTWLAAFGLASAAIAVAIAQQPPAPPGFAAGTELVRVDLVVTDKADHPVAGLTAKDFVVREDGKERPIVAFEAFGGGTPPPIAGDAGSAAPPGAAATILLVDDNQLTPQQAARVRDALKTLLAKAAERSGSLMLVAPGSQVSLLGKMPGNAPDLAKEVDRITGHHPDTHNEFPMSDDEALAIFRGDLDALARVARRIGSIHPELNADQANTIAKDQANMASHDARVRRDTLYAAVRVCLDWLVDRPGRHSLILVSAGFPQDPDDSNYFDVVTRSLRANAPIHFLDARGLLGISRYQSADNSAGLIRASAEGGTAWWDAAEGAFALADDTGGISVSNTNDMEKGLGRLLDSMTVYYLLAYQPPAHDKAGFRKIKVDVKGKGLTVRARRGYFSAAR